MTRLTFKVLVSSFAANMVVRQNAILHQAAYPSAALVVQKSFCMYVDDGLTGADSISEAIRPQKQLQGLFS